MNVRKKDFQRVVHDLKDFLSKLCGNDTAELRDAINFSLLHLHKYYKRLRHRTKAAPLLDGSLSLSSSLGSLSPASPFIPPANKFEWKWINLDSAQLSASFGHGDRRNLLPEVFYVLKDGDVERLQEMVKKDPDCINEVDALGRTTTTYCLHGKTEDHLKCLDILIQHGVDLQQQSNDGQAPIHVAVLCNNASGLDRLLAKKVNVNVEDNEGRYPMHLAAGYSSSSIVKKLLAAGGDKETLDNDEMTPVMWACYFDHHENVETLLNISVEDEMRYEIIDAEIQDKDVSGKCLLHWSVAAAYSKHCFKILFNPEYETLTDNAEKTLLHTIAENGAVGALEEYLAICESSDLDVADQDGRTPLHLACIGGHGEIVDIFLNRGASLDVIDESGKTPFDYAKSKSLSYCLLVIMSHIKYRQKTDHRNHGGEKLDTVANSTVGSNGKTAKPSNKPVLNRNLKNSQTTKGTVKSQNKVPSTTSSIARTSNASLEERVPILAVEVEDTEESRRRRDSDASQFDTPQDDSHNVQYKKSSEQRLEPPSPSAIRRQTAINYHDDRNDFRQTTDNSYHGDRNDVRQATNNSYHGDRNDVQRTTSNSYHRGDINDDVSDDSDENYNFNDQLIVLVEHQGSDDELVIDVNSGMNDRENDQDNGDGINHLNFDSSGEVNVDGQDQDLLDVTTFARNGSITTVGVVSEGNMAYNSVSMNQSVSSLLSSDDSGEEKQANRQQQQRMINQRRVQNDARKPLHPSSSMTVKRDQPNNEQQRLANRNQAITMPPKPQVSTYSPRSMSSGPSGGSIDMNSPSASLTAPVPPPSQYYSGGGGGGVNTQNAEVLVIHGDGEPMGDDEPPALHRGDRLVNDTRPKTSKGRKKSRPQVGESWPPAKSREEKRRDGNNISGKGAGETSLRQSTSPRSSSVRLAPLSPAALPKPPSFKY